jgi:valyl-tRNA synthetase
MSLEVPMYILTSEHPDILQYDGVSELLIKLGNLSTVDRTTEDISNAQSFIGMRHKYFVDLPIKIDVDAEKIKLQSEIDYTVGFINSIQKKLTNEKFVQNAPPDLLEKERKKLMDGETRLKSLEESLQSLNG